MRNKSKKLAAMLLVFTMLFSLLPVSAFADNDEAETAAVEPEVIVTETETEAADETEDVPAEPAEEETPAETDEEPIVIKGELEAEELEALPVGYERDVVFNPLFGDTASAGSVEYPAYPNPFANLMAVGDDCYSIYEAGLAVRSFMKSRVEEYDIVLHSAEFVFESDETKAAFLDGVMSAAFIHTGAPTEGDYIRWQWDDLGYSCSYYQRNGVYHYTFSFFTEYKSSADQESWMNSEVADLRGTLARDTDVETVRAVYDYVTANVTYDHANLNNDAYRLKYTAYAALHDHTAVCQGYALLMYRLLLEEGIDCRLIAGIGNGGPHGWNIVRIGDLYYDIDATWDAGHTNYYYFLTCEETFTENYTDHFRDTEYATPAFMAEYPMSPYDFQENLVVENGIIYYIEDGMAAVAGCTVETESLVIPAYVNELPVVGIIDEAFLDNATVTEVHISDGIQYIGDWAFCGCWNLHEVELPDTLVYLGEGAFAYCDGLTSVEIPDGLEEISAAAFYDCYNLTSLTLPQSVTAIGESAFSGTRIFEINYDGDDIGDISIEDDNFSINYVYYDGVTDGAAWSEEWGSAVLDDGILTISCEDGESAMPDFECAPWYPARAYIDHVVVENGITAIGAHAFECCYNLMDAAAADGVVSVGECAFNRCYNLYSLTFTNSVSTIGDNAFAECYSLSEIYYTGTAEDVRSIDVGEDNEAIFYTYFYLDHEGNSGICGDTVVWSVNDGVLTISGMGEIYDYASNDQAMPWYRHSDAVTSVVIEDGITGICDRAFDDFFELVSVEIPGTVTTIGESAFVGCSSLTDVYYDGTREEWDSITIENTEDNNTPLFEAAIHCKTVLAITAQPENVTAEIGDFAVFTVEAEGEELSYQWQYKTTNGTAWKNSSSATKGYNTAALEVVAAEARNGYSYRCKVTDAYGNTLTSSAAKLIINNLKITAQPKNVTAAVGGTAKFTVTAYGTGLKYQWQYQSAKNTTAWANSSSKTVGYNKATLEVDVTEARNGYKYRCVITDINGNTVTSDVVKLTVGAALAITKQPASVTAAVGETAVFTVGATGSGLSYQWQYKTTNGTTWKNSSSATVGFNTATLEVEATAARNGYSYRCKVTDANGNTLTSTAAKLNVTAAAPVINKQPTSATAAVGETAVFTVGATGSGLSYQWQYKTTNGTTWKNSSSATVGFNTATLEVEATAARNGYSYRCIITDANGNTVTTSAVKLTVR